MPDMLPVFLADREVACPNCSYNLRGLTSDRCPECDQEIVLGVNLAEPAIGAYIATMAPLWTLGGGGGAFLVIVLLVSIKFKELPPLGVFVMPCVAAVVGGLGAWLLGRRQGRVWFRRERARQRSMPVLTWSLLALCVLAFTIHLLVIM